MPASASRPGRWRDRALAAYACAQFPDDKAGWAARAAAVARPLLAQGGFDLILSSAPPVATHLLASRLARDSGLPWVADWRDLWTANPDYHLPRWRRAIDRRTEARWLAQAAGQVTVTPSWQQWLQQRVADPARVAFIPNGYDEADFAGTAAAVPRDDGLLRIVHTGTFYGHRSPLPVLQGAEALFARDPAAARRLRLRLVGPMGARFEPALARFDAAWPGVVERVAYAPHRASLAELTAADALLLVVGGSATALSAGMPAKLFEYLRAARPVLMIGPTTGDAADVLRAHAPCWTVAGDRPDEIARAYADLLAERLPSGGAADARRFERRELTRQLADFLRDCADRKGGTSR